ncbi:MAG: radical SAM protein [Lachnospiraceae bacterium]
MSKEKYVSWKESITIVRSSNNRYLLYDSLHSENKFIINDVCFEIVTLCNGKNSISDIVEKCVEKYKTSHKEAECNIMELLHLMEKEYQLALNYTDYPANNPISINIDTFYFPQVATLELTQLCNLRCIHCYGDYGSKAKLKQLSLAECKKILADLKRNDIKIIELTGGEITVHSEFEKILKFAVTCGFERIALLTNGLRFSNLTKEILCKNKEMFSVQIDLHSLDKKYLKWFTQCENVLEPVQENIEFCVKNNIRLRLATIVTPDNLDELESIVDWGYNAKVAGMGIGIVHDLGRAQINDSVLLKDETDWMKFGCILEKVVLKYPNFITEIDVTRQDDANCGSISSHIVIGVDGETKLCSLDALKELNSSLGNVLKNGLKDLYIKNQKFILAYGNLKVPKKNSKECSNCINKGFCDGCLYRGFVRGIALGNDCSWYKNVPETIKKKLSMPLI